MLNNMKNIFKLLFLLPLAFVSCGEDEDDFVEQNYLPEELKNKKYYRPTENGFEREIKKRIENLWREK